MMADPSPAVGGPRLESDHVHLELDIAIADDDASTVIHVRGPGTCSRMSDLGDVFDKLGVDVISCSTMPSAGSCDMTLVVVDRHDSQPLDDCLKQSVKQGLRSVLQQCSAASNCSSDRHCGAAAWAVPGGNGGSSVAQQQQQQQALLVPVGAGKSSSADSRSLMDLCRADSASESIRSSRACSRQPSFTDTEQQQEQHMADAASTFLGQVRSTAGAGAARPAAAADAPATSSGSHVRFSLESVSKPPATPRAANPCSFKPVLKIDIPFETSLSSTRHANIQTAPPTTAGDEHSSGEARAASSSTAAGVAAKEQQQQQKQEQQQNQGLQAQDLAQRLMQLGLCQHHSCVIGSDSDCDSERDVVCGSAGGSTGKLPKWVPLPSRSTGDLLSLARQQQQQQQPAGSTEQQVSPSGAPWRTVSSSTAAAAAASATPRAASDQHLSSMGPERSSHSDNILQRNGLGVAGAVACDAAAGAVPASPAVGRPRRRPPARTPSRIILSPVAPDGSADPQGQPKLFISIPKQSSEEKRSARRPVARSATCHNSMATTPISGGRQSVLQTLLGSQNSLGLLTSTGASPKAAAAAAAAAGMPYNVAVAAAQLLGNHGSTREAAAAAIAAAVANEQQPSSPLGSPVAAAVSSAVSSAEMLSSPIAATPRGMPLTPSTPVHPAVAAAAAAAIAAAAAEAGEAAAAAAAADGLAGGTSTIEEGEELSSCVSSANDADAEQDEDVDGSSSEEWWCGSLTGLTVRDIMTGPVKVVHQDADVAVARQLMVQHNLPGMLVDTGPGSEPGFLTRRDFFKASITRRGHRRKHPKASTVRDIMSHPVIAVDAGQPIELCAQMMQERGIRRAAVRDAETADPANHMAAYVGLVSDASIFRCLGLYPDDAEDKGLLALRNHSAMLDSSADGSGVDTPCSSRAGTPLMGPGGAAHGGAGGQQQLQQAPLGHAGAGGPGSAAAGEGAAGAGAGASPGGTPKRMPSLLTLPDIVMMREGLRLGESNASSSSAGSMGSTLSAAAATGAAGIGRLAPSSAAGELGRAGPAGIGDPPGSAAGGELLVGGSMDSTGGGVGALGLLGSSSSSGAPDALSRYRTAAALWEVDMAEVEMIRRIGEGSFGEVMLASYRGTKVAVKRLRVLDIDNVAPPLTYNASTSSSASGTASSRSGGSRGGSQAAFRQFFEREIAILASIRHPNVVNFIGACHKPGQRCLVTEYCARGSLDQVLHKSGLALDLVKRVEFAMDIARGMACLHAQRPIIIHRDLKTANLLVSARFEVKVADFGLSRIKDASHLQVSRAGLEGTIEYCAPEVLRGEPYTERCDIYSFGVVLWELLLRQRPYSDADVPVFLLMVNIGNGSLKLPDIPVEAATPGLVHLAEHCLSFGAADRPDFREVLQLLEVEYRALRASQPRTQQRQPSQTHQQAPAVLRCDSASSMAVHQSPQVTSDTPNDGNTPALQSPAGSGGSGFPLPQHAAAAAAGGSMGIGPAPAAEGSGLMFNDPYYQQQILQQLQQQQYFQQQQMQQQLLHQQQMQQQRSSRLSQADSLTSVTANSAQLIGLPLLFDQQQLLSVPLPQLLIPQQHSIGNSTVNSPRQQQQGLAAAGAAPPGMRVLSAFGGQHHHTPSGVMAAGGGGGSGGAASGGTAVPSSSSKPPRSKQHLSRARSMPVPESINWQAEDAEEEQHDGGDGDGGLAEMLAGESSFSSDNYNPGGMRCVSNVSAVSGYSALSGVSNLSASGAYAPCPPSAQLMFLDPAAGSGCLNGGILPQLTYNPAAGVYVAAQQQVLLTASGQPVLVQQPALMQSYMYPQQPLPQQHSQDYCQYVQQQQGQQFEQQQGQQFEQQQGPQQSQLQGQYPVQQGPQQRLVQSSMHQQALMAAAARGREPGGSGAASPNHHLCASNLSLQGMHRRSSSQGSRGIPALHVMQLGELGGSPTALSARDRGSGSSTPVLGGGVAPAGGVAAPLLLQRLDSLNRSGSASPLSRSGSFSLLPAPAMMQSVDYTGQPQLVGVLVGGSGQSSPIPHYTGGRSRLASSGGAEFGSSPPPVSYLQSAHMQQHLQPTRRPSLLRNESRDRAASPFAAVLDNQVAAGHGLAAHGRSPFAGAAASPFAAASGAAGDAATHSPFAAASGASFSPPTDDQRTDVGVAACAAATAAAAGSARSSTPARSPFAAAASPFAAVSGAVDDVDTGSVADTNSTGPSPVSERGGGKGGHAERSSSSAAAAAAAGGHGGVGGRSSSKPAVSPFLLLQQMQTEEEEVGDFAQQ